MIEFIKTSSGGRLILDTATFSNLNPETELELICSKYDVYKTSDMTFHGDKIEFFLDQNIVDNDKFWKEVMLWQLKN